MNNIFWKIDPQYKVSKVQILFNGKETGLQKLKEYFSNVKSSQIYPSFEKNYKYTIFFYDTSEEFINALRTACERIFPEYIDTYKPKKKSAITYFLPLIILSLIAYGGYYIYNQIVAKKLLAIQEQLKLQEQEIVVTEKPKITEETEQKEITEGEQPRVKKEKKEVTATEEEAEVAAEEEDKTKQKLIIFFIDVGQGDAILIKTPKNYWYMIDAGPGGSYRNLYAVLKDLKVKKIETLVMTHAHEDHIGGVPKLLEDFKIKEVIDPGVPYTSSLYNKILSRIKSKRIKYIIAKAGMKLKWSGLKNVVVLNPFKHSDFEEINNSSVVIRIKHKNISFLLTGDAEKEVEEEIIKKFQNINSTVLKVGHHGSNSSTTKKFLEKVKPKYAIISVARVNKYGHPHPKTIRLLQEKRIKIFQTMDMGTIVIETDGVKIKIMTLDEYLSK